MRSIDVRIEATVELLEYEETVKFVARKISILVMTIQRLVEK